MSSLFLGRKKATNSGSWHKGKLRRDFRWLGACLLDEAFGILAYRSHQQSSTRPTSWPMLEPGEWAEIGFDRMLTS